MSAAYVQVRLRLNLFMEANDMKPDLGPYCLQYRLPKNISRQEEQTTKVVTVRLRDDCLNAFLNVQQITFSNSFATLKNK